MERRPVGKLLLFGATGDLAQRMLLPSLYGLHADGLLPRWRRVCEQIGWPVRDSEWPRTLAAVTEGAA